MAYRGQTGAWLKRRAVLHVARRNSDDAPRRADDSSGIGTVLRYMTLIGRQRSRDYAH